MTTYVNEFNFTPHCLRHTGCIRYSENGMDPRELQYLMGHKRMATTMEVYNHVNERRASKELERMAGVYKEA